MSLTIEDRVAIYELYSRWNVAIDDGDADGWADTYVPDGVWELVGFDIRCQGREALVDFARTIFAHDQGLNRHLALNVLVTGDGDRAAGRADVVVLELRTGGDARIIKTSRYRDTIARLNGRWLFVERINTWDTPDMPEQPHVEGVANLFK